MGCIPKAWKQVRMTFLQNLAPDQTQMKAYKPISLSSFPTTKIGWKAHEGEANILLLDPNIACLAI